MRSLAQTFLSLAVIYAPIAESQEESSSYEGSVELGLGQTDNLNRDAEEIGADIGRLSIALAGRADRQWFRSAVSGDIEYRKYNADEPGFDDDEVLGSADGLVELHAVPDRVQWDVRVGYGHVRIDTLGAVGPSNRQRITSFSTGPQISLPLGNRTMLQVGGTVSEQSFEVTQQLDGRVKAARLGLERQIDSITQLALSLDGREIEYDLNSQQQEFATVSLEYRRELASGEALASLGRGRVEIDGDKTDPVTVGQIVWSRAVGARSRVEICAGREITDAGSSFAGAGVAAGCPGDFSGLENVTRTTTNREQQFVSTANPLVRDGGSLSFEIDGAKGAFRATVSIAQDRFEEDATFNNDSTALELSGSRNLARDWSAEISARIWVQDFTELGDKNEDHYARFSISRSLARNMRITVSFEHNRRVGDVVPFEANEYFLSFGRDFGL